MSYEDRRFNLIRKLLDIALINKRGFKYEVQHGLKIHETPDVEF